MSQKPLPAPRVAYNTQRLLGISNRATNVFSELRNALLDPWPRKHAPAVTGSRLAKLLKLTPEKLNYHVRRNEIPPGVVKSNGRSREYPLEEAQTIIRQWKPQRPEGKRGAVVSVGNFKGGVGKTTLAVALAQGMTLLGHKVLLIDLDPQASSTTLMGFVPDAEVDEDKTVMPVVYGEEDTLETVVQSTYWPNLDFIPASPSLFGADFYLPNKQTEDSKFEFWNILENVMDPLRAKYDVIVIDTPPTLSYLAIASFMATDGLVVPVPPETLDYASSTQFFRQFAELFRSMTNKRGVTKEFQFIKVFLSKVKEKVTTTTAVRSWIKTTYPELVASAEILESDVVKNASAQFCTIYDISQYEGSQKTYNRALETFDAVVAEVEDELQLFWASDASDLPRDDKEKAAA